MPKTPTRARCAGRVAFVTTVAVLLSTVVDAIRI
jgi:hypothetical protein